jgi:glycosyltransferase involved in cell wall biosynthesis
MVKNPWAAIRVLMKLPSNYKLVMVGSQSFNPGEPMPTVAKLIKRLRFEDRVRFIPTIPFVGDALAGADCLVQFSFREADSLVVKEAFLAGLPVVHTGVGAIPEMEAEHGPIGWHVPFLGPEPVELLDRPYDADPGDYGICLIDPRDESVDFEVAAGQVIRAASPEARPIAEKMRSLAWEHWTGPTMCANWATYLEGVVSTWDR